MRISFRVENCKCTIKEDIDIKLFMDVDSQIQLFELKMKEIMDEMYEQFISITEDILKRTVESNKHRPTTNVVSQRNKRARNRWWKIFR
jgi:ERCC4-related helicase